MVIIIMKINYCIIVIIIIIIAIAIIIIVIIIYWGSRLVDSSRCFSAIDFLRLILGPSLVMQ